MRETLAKVLAAALTVMIVVFAALFSLERNRTDAPPPGPSSAAVPPPPLDASQVARGRAVFEAQSCERCHSVGGLGNPRSPLDGVGARLGLEELVEGVTGGGSARGRVTRSVLRVKQGFALLSEEDLRALTVYLSSLR